MIVFVAALVAGGTGAFFSDTETSTGNTFTAGELDLTIDNSSYGFDWNRPGAVDPSGIWGPNEANSWELSDLTDQLFFSFEDLKPGDYGEDTISLHVQNDAWACMAFDLTATPENTVNGPEADVPDRTVGADEGELQDFLSFLFWRDDGDNVFEEGEDVIEALSGLPGSVFTGDFLPLAVPDDEPLAAGETTFIGKGWCFGTMTQTPEIPAANAGGPTPGNTGFTCDGSGDHNIAQTDGIVVDVEFYSEQARNNDNFQCPNGDQGPTTAALTVDKVVTFTNATVVGVDVNDFQLHINGPGGDQIVTDEVEVAGLAPGVYTVSEVYSGDPAGITFDAVFSGACSEIPVDTETGTVTLVAGDDLTCTITNVVDSPPQP